MATLGNAPLTRITSFCRHGDQAKTARPAIHARPLCRVRAGDRLFRRQRLHRQSRAAGKQDLDQQFASLSEELDQLKQQRADWQRRVKLLKSDSIDPDTLEKRARAVLNYLDPRELTLVIKRHSGRPTAGSGNHPQAVRFCVQTLVCSATNVGTDSAIGFRRAAIYAIGFERPSIDGDLSPEESHGRRPGQGAAADARRPDQDPARSTAGSGLAELSKEQELAAIGICC